MAVDGFLNFDTKINTKGFQKGTKSLSNSLSGLNSKLNGIAKAAVAAFSIKQIAAFTKSCKEAYQVQFEAEARLEQVMKNTMGATQDQIQSVKEYAAELQKVGVIGDEITLSGLQELGTYVENADSLKTMSVVLDDMLAQQYGLNATAENAVTISTMLGKVLEGQTSALSRYGYKFDEAQEQLLKYGTEEQRVATLADVVEASVGGMNEALARTPAGRLKQISNNMGDVKEQFGKAVTNIQALFLPALERLAATLQRVADLAVRVSEALANVFGITLNQSTAVTGSISASVEAQDALTEAVKETNKAQKNSLASFDKINTLATETAEETTVSGGVSMPVTLDETPVEKQISNLEKKIQALIEPFKLAWENKGEDLMEAISNRWGNLKDLAGSVAESFKTAWKENNVGQSIIEHIIGAYTEYNNTIANLTKSIREGWEKDGAGERIFSTVLKFINAVADIAERFWKATADWAADVNFAPLFDSIAKLLEVLEPIGEKIGEGLLWFYKNVILPFAGWVIEEALPASIDAVAAAVEALEPIVDGAKDTLKWLWEDFLKPLGEWAGGITIDGLQKLSDIFKEIGDYIEKHPALQAMLGKLALAGAALALFGPVGFVVSGLLMGGAAAKEVYDNRSDIWDTIKEEGGLSEFNRAWTTDMVRSWGLDGIADAMEKISGFLDKTDDMSPFFSIWTDFWENIGGKIYDVKETISALADVWINFWEGVGEKVAGYQEAAVKIWGDIKDSFIDAKDSIVDTWSGVADWFSGIWDNIKNAFSNVGSWFKDRFQAAWENITNIFKGVGNWFGKRWDDIKGAFSNVGSWFKERFENARTNVKELWGNVGNWFGERWEDIKDKFKGVGSWFKERFQAAYDNIVNIFKGIGGFFSGLWEDIINGLHNGINWAIDKINGLLSRLNDGINSVVDALRSAFSIDIPSDVPVFGGTSFSLDIPKLATGTVIPANYGNFLAMLGDNNREAEVVSPLSTIERAVELALSKYGGSQTIHVHLELDSREIGRVAVKAVNSDNARKGR